MDASILSLLELLPKPALSVIGGKKMDELRRLLLEGREIERRLIQIKKEIAILTKLMELDIDLDKWEIKKS